MGPSRKALDYLAGSDRGAVGRSLVHLGLHLGGDFSLVRWRCWDISWHESIGRDTFWTAPPFFIHFGGILAGAAAAYLNGWTFGGRGTLISLPVGLDPFVKTLELSGKVGTTIHIRGSDLTAQPPSALMARLPCSRSNPKR